MEKLTGMTVKAGGKTYDFTLKTKETLTTDDQGSETKSTVTTVTYGGKEVELGSFTAFYNNVALIELCDPKTDSKSGKEALAVTYTFEDGSSDEVVFADAGTDSYIVTFNGENAGHSAKGDVTRAVKSIAEVVK